jgi:hypothetical protein
VILVLLFPTIQPFATAEIRFLSAPNGKLGLSASIETGRRQNANHHRTTSFQAKPQHMIDSEPLGDVERLQRQASALETTAEALTRAYNRATWIRFLLVFIPVPFVVLLLRLYLDAWGYYVAGGMFIVCGAALFSLDSAASAKCDAATRAAENAGQALEEARVARDAAPR